MKMPEKGWIGRWCERARAGREVVKARRMRLAGEGIESEQEDTGGRKSKKDGGVGNRPPSWSRVQVVPGL